MLLPFPILFTFHWNDILSITKMMTNSIFLHLWRKNIVIGSFNIYRFKSVYQFYFTNIKIYKCFSEFSQCMYDTTSPVSVSLVILIIILLLFTSLLQSSHTRKIKKLVFKKEKLIVHSSFLCDHVNENKENGLYKERKKQQQQWVKNN